MVTTESFRYDKNLLLSFSVFWFLNRDGNGILTGWLGRVDGEGVVKGGWSGVLPPTSSSSSPGLFGSGAMGDELG